LEEGYTEKDAKRLIGCVVSAEIFDILKKNEKGSSLLLTHVGKT
jgi:hypothetical protein